MAYQVLARKYRPHRFEDVVAQPHIVQALSNALNKQHLHHAYLFTGTRGVGKTTTARILAKCLNCEQGVSATPCDTCDACQEIDQGRFMDLFEIDAASRTKVEDTREILDNVQYRPTKGRYKVYLIDEVHMLSGHSFNALLKTLEEPPEHVKFLLATTDHQKLPATVLSRCLQFHLLPMPVDAITDHLATLLGQEKITFEAEALPPIAKAANGSMRDALSLLDQCIAYGDGKISHQEVCALLGTIESTTLAELLTALAEQDATKLLALSEKLSTQGADFTRALDGLLSMLHDIAVEQAIASSGDTVIKKLASDINRENVQLYYQIALLGQQDLSQAPSPKAGFEMTLLRMLAFTPGITPSVTASTSDNATQNTKPHQSIATANNPTGDSSDWNTLLSRLNLKGVTAQLLQHCDLVKRDDANFEFLLSPSHAPMLTDMQRQRIRDALNQTLGRDDVQVTITIAKSGDSPSNTPAQQAVKQTEQRQQQAEQRISEDPTVQRIMQTFDATVIKDSITPVTEVE